MYLRKKLKRALALVLVFCLSASLVSVPAYAAEEEGSGRVLICGETEHTHGPECYGDPVLVCGQEEFDGHKHTDACYGEETLELTCGLEETGGHTHDDSCYITESKLTCDIPENHHHTVDCYLIGEPGSEQMIDGEWYSVVKQTCTIPEGHEHTDACYTTERVLDCGQEEAEAHTHTDECYTATRPLICEEEESGHTHTNACYERPLICEIPEHTHTDACYAAETVEPEIDAETQAVIDQFSALLESGDRVGTVYNAAILAYANLTDEQKAQVIAYFGEDVVMEIQMGEAQNSTYPSNTDYKGYAKDGKLYVKYDNERGVTQSERVYCLEEGDALYKDYNGDKVFPIFTGPHYPDEHRHWTNGVGYWDEFNTWMVGLILNSGSEEARQAYLWDHYYGQTVRIAYDHTDTSGYNDIDAKLNCYKKAPSFFARLSRDGQKFTYEAGTEQKWTDGATELRITDTNDVLKADGFTITCNPNVASASIDRTGTHPVLVLTASTAPTEDFTVTLSRTDNLKGYTVYQSDGLYYGTGNDSYVKVSKSAGDPQDIVKPDGDNGSLSVSGSFTVKATSKGYLRIKKDVTGITNADLYKDKEFNFKITGPTDKPALQKDYYLTVTGGETATLDEKIPVGNYTITETGDKNIPGFKWVGGPADGSITVKKDETVTFTATNKYELNKVKLDITKVLGFTSDTDEAKVAQKYKDHLFTFTLTGTDVNGNSYGPKDITLKSGQTNTFTDLTRGTYTITESNYDIPDFKYQGVTVSNGTITDTDDDNHTITFELIGDASLTFTASNNYEVNRVALQITKEIELDDSTTPDSTYKMYAGKVFTFDVTGKDPNDNTIRFEDGTTTKEVTLTLDATGKTGTETLNNLPVGKYTITETSHDLEHYTFGGVTFKSDKGTATTDDKSITVDLTGQSIAGTVEVTATNKYTLKDTELSVEKVVMLDDLVGNDNDLVKGLQFVFKVTGVGLNGEKLDFDVLTLNAVNGWKQTIKGLPIGTYTVEEVKRPPVQYFDAGSVEYTLNDKGVELNEDGTVTLQPNDELKVVATNNYSIKKVDLELTKNFKTDNMDMPDDSEQYFVDKTYKFLVEGPTMAGKNFTEEVELTYKSPRFELKGIPVGIYTIKEIDSPSVENFNFADFVVTGDGVTYNSSKNAYEVDLSNYDSGEIIRVDGINYYSAKTGEIKIHKDISLDASLYGGTDLVKEDFTFHLVGTTVSGLSRNDIIQVHYGETATFTKLPFGTYTITEDMDTKDITDYDYKSVTFNVNGEKKAEYTADELEVENKGVDITLNDANESADVALVLGVTNEYTRKLGDLSVKKVISGNNMDYNSKYDFTIALRSPTEGLDPSYVGLKDTYDYTVTDAQNNPVADRNNKITKLTNEDGTAQTVMIGGEAYTVYGTITGLGNNETATVTGLPVGTKWHVVEVKENDGYSTNYQNQDGVVAEGAVNSTVVTNSNDIYTSVSVQKVWVGDTENLRPTAITVQLLKNGEPMEGKTEVLNASNGWRASWSGLPYGSRYSVSEVGSYPGYTSTVTGDGSGTTVNITLTNTYDERSDNTRLRVNKIWEGDDPFTRPNEITVQLLRNGQPNGTVTLSESNNWTYEWTGLDASATYDVEEVDIPAGYTSSKTVNGRTYTIYNTYDTTIPDEDIPLADLPENDIPLADLPDDDIPLTELPDDEIPLDEAPQTGDNSRKGLWLALAICSAFGMAISGKLLKTKEEDQGDGEN